MKQRYSVLLISIILLIVIIVLECFTDDEETIQTLPVSYILNYTFEDSDTKINIDLKGINSSSECAKNVNKEIENLFLSNAQNIIDNHENYTGKYELITEYNLNNNLLSIKIYENDSNEENTSGNIFATVYDVKKNYEYNLSAACEHLKLDFNTVINEAKEYAKDKNKYIDFDVPYIYINNKGNLELIIKNLIQVDKKTFWNNIEIFEVIIEDDAEETDKIINR